MRVIAELIGGTVLMLVVLFGGLKVIEELQDIKNIKQRENDNVDGKLQDRGRGSADAPAGPEPGASA